LNPKSLVLTAACSWHPAAVILSRLLPNKHIAADLHRPWEEEYAQGGWDWLQRHSETPHNHVIAALAGNMKPRGAILDVGCGKGVLHSILQRQGYERYVGIDLSPTAVAAASADAAANAEFMVCDALDFHTDIHFDAIILNEVLYYFPDPASDLQNLSRALKTGGIFIISMARAGVRDALAKQLIWRSLRHNFEVLEQISLHYTTGLPRTVAVLRPRRNGPSEGIAKA
jgi:SAM-dependent methyltransferase